MTHTSRPFHSLHLDIADASLRERMDMVRRGIRPDALGWLASELGVAEEHLGLYMGLPRRVVRKRLLDGERFTSQESESVVALARLLGEAERTGRRNSLAAWLRTPIPLLDGSAPLQFFDVAEGRALVSALWRDTPAPLVERNHGKNE